jgi:hypothetical protein
MDVIYDAKGDKMQKEELDETGTRTQEDCSTRKLVLRLTLTWRHNQLGHLTGNWILIKQPIGAYSRSVLNL